MAATVKERLFMFVLSEIMDDEDDENILEIAKKSRSSSACVLAGLRRDVVPKVTNYMGSVIPEMCRPENIDDFRVHYRVSRHLFDVILEEILPALISNGSGPHENVRPEKKLLVFLCYLANMQSMREVDHVFNLSMSTVHAIISETLDAVVQLGYQVIRWPSQQRQLQISREVEDTCTLPGIVGFLDGCHIRLSSALHGERDYYNRKGYPSMHRQAVVDHEMRITNAYTGWPGCVHDARVLRNSSLFEEAEAGRLIIQNHHIFADSAYPLRNWLITPFRNHGNLTPQQIRFNRKLSSVRQTVERAFGHLKGRFRRLQDVPLHNSKDICQLIYAGCILHNLCLLHEDDVEEYIHEEHEDPDNVGNIYQNGHDGLVKRLRLVNVA